MWAVLVVLLFLMQLFLGIEGVSRSTASNIEGTMNIKWLTADPLHPHVCNSPCNCERNMHLEWSFVASLFIPASVSKQQLLHGLFFPTPSDSSFCSPCASVHPVCFSVHLVCFMAVHLPSQWSCSEAAHHVALSQQKYNKCSSKGEWLTTVKN